MINLIIVPYIPIANSHCGRGLNGYEILFCILFSIYLTNIIIVCIERSIGNYSRNEFLIKLIIPFSIIGKAIFNLFKED